jgi:rhodanese-related sulfurtransferase
MFKYGNRTLALLSVGGFCLALLSGCSWFESNKEKTPALYLVNVLDKPFFDDCHIPGSLNVSMMDIKNVAQSWSKSADVVIYCSNYSCEASTHCCKMLQTMGFEKVWDYEEGMAGWYQAHVKDSVAYPIVGEAQQPYLTMENKPLVETAQAETAVKKITTEQLKELINSCADEGKKHSCSCC